MAVQPRKVINHVSQNDNEAFDALEEAIDEELLRWQSEVRNNEPVFIKIGANITSGVKEIVVERYQEQGWTVEVIHAGYGECFRFTRSKDVRAVLEETATAIGERIKDIKARAKTFFKF